MDDDMRNEEMALMVMKAGMNVSTVQQAINSGQNPNDIVNIAVDPDNVIIQSNGPGSTVNNNVGDGVQNNEVIRCAQDLHRVVGNSRYGVEESPMAPDTCLGNVLPDYSGQYSGQEQTYGYDACLIFFQQGNVLHKKITLHK